MRTRIRLAAVALALVTPFGVVACGGGAEDGEDGQEQMQEDGEEEDD